MSTRIKRISDTFATNNYIAKVQLVGTDDKII